MSEFVITDAEPDSYVNEYGTTIATDTTETFDTAVEGEELVVRWFGLRYSFDGRGERKQDQSAQSVELMRLDRETAAWLRDELNGWLS